MNVPIILIGAGGHGKVLLDALSLQEKPPVILGAVTSLPGSSALGEDIKILGDDTAVAQHLPASVSLVNGIGSTDLPEKREAVFLRFKRESRQFRQVIHPRAIIASSARLGEGAQVMAGAIIQADAMIGDNSIVNTGAIVDHDCRIGRHVHIASGAVLSGGVTIGDRTHIGAGAVIIQGITIGRDCVIGAGSVVIKNIGDNVRAVGNPARELQQQRGTGGNP